MRRQIKCTRVLPIKIPAEEACTRARRRAFPISLKYAPLVLVSVPFSSSGKRRGCTFLVTEWERQSQRWQKGGDWERRRARQSRENREKCTYWKISSTSRVIIKSGCSFHRVCFTLIVPLPLSLVFHGVIVVGFLAQKTHSHLLVQLCRSSVSISTWWDGFSLINSFFPPLSPLYIAFDLVLGVCCGSAAALV